MRALIVGASGGIGEALAARYAAHGDVIGLSRSAGDFELTDEDSIAAAAARLKDQRFDRIVVATGALTIDGVPPERAFRQLDPAVMARSLALNTIGPAMSLKHLVPLLPRDRPSVFALLSARLGSIGDNRLGGWMSYRASKAALNQIVRCAAIEHTRRRPRAAIVALHPGTIPTPMSEPYARGRYTATRAQAAEQLAAVMDGLGPEDSGGFFDYSGTSIPW